MSDRPKTVEALALEITGVCSCSIEYTNLRRKDPSCRFHDDYEDIKQALLSFAAAAAAPLVELLEGIKCSNGFYPDCITAKAERQKLSPVCFSEINTCKRCETLTTFKSKYPSGGK